MLRRRVIGLLAVVPVALYAKKREWREGQLISVDVKDFTTGKKQNHIMHRYVCTVADKEFRYVVEYEKPVRIAVNDRLRFTVDKDKLTLVDADGKERQATIEQRIRIVSQ